MRPLVILSVFDPATWLCAFRQEVMPDAWLFRYLPALHGQCAPHLCLSPMCHSVSSRDPLGAPTPTCCCRKHDLISAAFLRAAAARSWCCLRSRHRIFLSVDVAQGLRVQKDYFSDMINLPEPRQGMVDASGVGTRWNIWTVAEGTGARSDVESFLKRGAEICNIIVPDLEFIASSISRRGRKHRFPISTRPLPWAGSMAVRS